jgi:hypothetical protein
LFKVILKLSDQVIPDLVKVIIQALQAAYINDQVRIGPVLQILSVHPDLNATWRRSQVSDR